MYWKDVANLVKVELTEDEEGYKSHTEARREVFVNKKSATRSEFYTAKQAGDKIVLVLEVKAADYQGEERVEFDRKPYEVVRAYTPPNGEKVELNLKEAPVAAKAAQEPPGEEGKG